MITSVMIVAIAVIAACTAGAYSLRVVSRIWLRHLLERQPTGALVAEQYLSRPQRLHAAAGGATALAAFAIGAAAAPTGASLATGVALVAAFTAVCLFGVAVPRGLARRFPTRTVPLGLPLLRAADVVLAPVRTLAERTAGATARATPLPEVTPPTPHSDLADLLREGQLEGVGEQTELAIISGVVQFGDKRAADVMTPRAQLFALDVSRPAAELARAVAASGYSRVPVFRGTIDDVAGLVLAFDVLRTAGEVAPPIHPVFNTTLGVPCTELLARMLRAGLHLAVVRDDAGATAGIVTLEDLLEELVGDIRDEHDEPGPAEPGGFPDDAARIA